MAIRMNTLRPGLLVSLNTSVRGNVNYNKEEIEADHVTEEGKRQAKWLTERVISDPEEHENAIKVRSKALSLVRSVCSRSAFGLLCPEIASESLQSAIAEARRLADEFNATATLTHVSVYVMIGRIAPDDVEAVKAINSEVRELMEAMEDGLKKLDPKTVRDAANRARNIGAMLTGDAAARVRNAIDVARSAARQIVKSAEEGEAEIDRQAIRRIEEARTAFLDFDDAGEIAAPQVEGRSLDLAPLRPVGKPTVTANAVEL